ncbi:MAG: abortive infection family protein [Patescibacteria group bacterium]|nr:abortive infection family protein [Patescibacteria group bacterium]
MRTNELLGLIEDVKNTIINMATGVDFGYEKYESAREKIISRSELKTVLPDWLIDKRYGSQFWPFIKSVSATYDGRRTFLRSAFDEIADFVRKGGSQPVAVSLTDPLEKIDNAQLDNLWKKSVERLQSDPEGAITAAKSLFEATMKYILDKENQAYSRTDGIMDLYKKVKKVLNLDPNNHNLETYKQILNGIASVVSGLSNLRNDYSDAHGRGKDGFVTEIRHAELTINLAGSLCTFLLNSYLVDGSKE